MFIKLFHRLEETLIGILLVVITLLVFVDVVQRFTTGAGFHWSQEVTLLLNAWFILLGASWALREKAHISVDAFVRKLPHKFRVIATSLAISAALFYVSFFLYGSYIYLAKMKKYSLQLNDVPLEKWVAMSVLIIGFGLMGLRLLGMLWRVIKHGEVEQFHHDELADLNELSDPAGEVK